MHIKSEHASVSMSLNGSIETSKAMFCIDFIFNPKLDFVFAISCVAFSCFYAQTRSLLFRNDHQ